MNEHSQIQQLLQKFVLNQCSPQEIAIVIAYFKENNLTSDFPTVADVQKLLIETPQMNPATADKIFSNILAGAKEPEVISIAPQSNNYKKYIAIAASIVIMLGIGWSYRLGIFDSKKQMVLTGNEITVQLDNGEIQVISDTKKSVLKDAHGNIIGNHNGNVIAYDSETPIENLVYSTIKIPNGKRFQLQLSDGTIVHLNSGTTFKYPVKFIASENRQVFLNGEAYFDVTKDKTHPFIVNANELNVRVLGTHFNVSDYPEDELTDVVLVEGSVGMYNAGAQFDANSSTILKPGFKGSFNKNSRLITTKPVTTAFYTSWIEGGQCFRNMTFENIARKLERHYDVTINTQNSKLSDEKFNASFGDEPIEKVLSYFNEIHAFNYTVKGDQIIIK